MVYYKYLGSLGRVDSCLVLLKNEISIFMKLMRLQISWWMSATRTWNSNVLCLKWHLFQINNKINHSSSLFV